MGLSPRECRIEAEQHILANSSDEVQVSIQDLENAPPLIGGQLQGRIVRGQHTCLLNGRYETAVPLEALIHVGAYNHQPGRQTLKVDKESIKNSLRASVLW